MGLFFTRYSSRLNLGEKEIKKTLTRRLIWIFLIVVTHALAFFTFEPVTLREAFWVTVTTLTTVGYGDISATTAFGQISTTILCFLVGIPMLASVWDAYSTWRDGVRNQKRTGRYRWELKNHILIASFPKDYSVDQMIRLIRAIRSQEAFSKKPIQIVTRRFEGTHLPQELTDLGNIAHVNGIPSDKQTLSLATAEQASHIIILRDREDNDPEGHSFNICSRIREINTTASIIAQVDDPHSRAAQRLYRSGANSILRPAKAYPEIIALSMMNDGVNDLFEDLLSIEGTEFRLIPYSGHIKWQSIHALAQSKDYGLPIGIQKPFTNKKGACFFQPVLAPASDFEEDVTGIYVISRKKDGQSFSDKDWQTLLESSFASVEIPCSTLHILNLPVNQACPLEYITRLTYQLRQTTRYANSLIRIVCEDMPESIQTSFLKNLDDAWHNVELVGKTPSVDILDKIESNTFSACYNSESVVAMLNNDDDSDPDGFTYELIDLLRFEGGFKGLIIAEAESDDERERLYLTGADHCLRPVRGYPGMLARTLTNPGVEKAVESFFRFNDVCIQKRSLAELLGNHATDQISFGDLKKVCQRKSQGVIPVSVRCNGETEDVICPSNQHMFDVKGSTVLTLSREK